MKNSPFSVSAVKKIKILSILIFLLAAAYFALAALSFRAYSIMVSLAAHYGMSEAQWNHEAFAGVRRGALVAAVVFSILGLLIGIIGAGIFFRREWARKIWLWAVLILLLLHLERVSAALFGGDGFILVFRLAEFALVGAIAIFSRFYLQKDSIREHFKKRQ